MYEFKESTLRQNQDYFKQYVEMLGVGIDSFQEEHILKSRVFSIYVRGIYQGYFAFCENVFEIKDFTVLTQFVLDQKALMHSQLIFKKILEEYKIISSFVSSADEVFLSLSMDFHKSVTMQAYMFIDGQVAVRNPEFPKNYIVPAKEEDFPLIQRLSKNYFDFLLAPEKKGKFQLFILEKNRTILGFGLLEDGEIMNKTKSLGIYTIEEHRKKGVGRSIMMYLKDLCYEQGYYPLTGCNWYNENSKNTLESAGFISKSRLYKVEFTDELQWVSI
ncbi:GNAT family N-acetyltransferase [Mycoplasmatota bacterium]|nr:GNAT family N-acetyltransferase [Mycoplasmatota bacterium]